MGGGESEIDREREGGREGEGEREGEREGGRGREGGRERMTVHRFPHAAGGASTLRAPPGGLRRPPPPPPPQHVRSMSTARSRSVTCRAAVGSAIRKRMCLPMLAPGHACACQYYFVSIFVLLLVSAWQCFRTFDLRCGNTGMRHTGMPANAFACRYFRTFSGARGLLCAAEHWEGHRLLGRYRGRIGASRMQVTVAAAECGNENEEEEAILRSPGELRRVRVCGYKNAQIPCDSLTVMRSGLRCNFHSIVHFRRSCGTILAWPP